MAQPSKNVEREGRILDAAIDLIAHYGYGKTTIDDIAAQAGISKGAVYLHFRSKEALLDRLVIRESERLLDQIMARLDNDPQGMTLFNIYRHSMLAANENPLMRALYNRDRRILGDYLRRMQKTPVFQHSMMFGTDFIAHFQRAGMITSDVSAETIAYILMTIRYGMMNVEEFAPGTESPPLEEMGEILGRMLETSFGTGAGNSEQAREALKTLFEQGREMLRQMTAFESVSDR